MYYYYIKHHIKQIEQLETGTTFKEVSRDDLCKFPILTIGAKDIYVQGVRTDKHKEHALFLPDVQQITNWSSNA